MEPATTVPNTETRLPRAVIKASDLLKARLEARNAAKQDPNPVVEPQQDTPSVEPVQTTPVEQNAPPAPAADPRDTDPSYWKHRFKTAEGLLKAARDGRQSETLALNQRIAELQEQLRTLQASQTASEEVDPAKFFTQEQIEMLGAEEAKAIAKANLTTVRQAIQEALDREIKPLKEAAKNAETMRVKDRQEVFQDKLSELIPNYQDIDITDGWKGWLANEDEATGLERQTILDAHVRKFDATKVAAMFRSYQKGREVPVPQIAPSGSGGVSQEPPVAAAEMTNLTPPSPAEIKAFHTRAALSHNKRPGQAGYVSDKERSEFEARLKLRASR